MSERKLTLVEVADIVDAEGLGYAVQSYMDADKIEDQRLAELWSVAAEALDEICKILKPYMP